MPAIIFQNGEPCPHCEDNKHHMRTADKKITAHPCEFCDRIDAKGEKLMSIAHFEKAERCEWKETLMFGGVRQ